MLRDHLLRLDPASRNARFHGGISDQSVSAYAMRAAETATVFAFLAEGEVMGSCELFVSDGGDAEAAVSVEADWRNQGVGRRLLALAVDEASVGGSRQVEVVTPPSNLAMRKIAASLGGRYTATGSEGRCLVPAASGRSRAA